MKRRIQTHRTNKGASAYIIKSNDLQLHPNYNPQVHVSPILCRRPILGSHWVRSCWSAARPSKSEPGAGSD